MKNAIQLRKLFVVILSISVAGVLFGILGCEKGGEEVGAPPDLIIEEGQVPEQGEVTEQGEATEVQTEGKTEAEVTEQIVYVTEGGTGDGTKENPMGDINQAIEHAESTWSTPSEVHVAEGTYEVDSSKDTQIKMVEGVSMLGGFSADDWTKRDPSTYVTTIKDTSSSGGDSPSPNRVIEATGKITSATIIDGFKIEGGGGDYSSGIVVGAGAAPTISNCTIDGGSGKWAYGIHNKGSPSVHKNMIRGNSTSSKMKYAYGMYNSNSMGAVISDNTINGGNASTSYAIYNCFKVNPQLCWGTHRV
ncbi:MAG: hypothetical protein ABH871_02465 [Pseudomonadota bacterium]